MQMRRVGRRRAVTALPIFALLIAAPVHSQKLSTLGWSGWVRCDVAVQGAGYTDQQTHTWIMSGGAPTVTGAFRVYPATWSVVGGGGLTRTQGNQTLTAQWATNATTSGPLAVFVRASDGSMLIQSRHAQLRVRNAVQGYQQQTIKGVAQPPAVISLEAFEWSFPAIVVTPPTKLNPNATANGSKTTPTTGSVGPMQPGGSQGSAACTWQFGQGSAAPAPPPTIAARAVPAL